MKTEKNKSESASKSASKKSQSGKKRTARSKLLERLARGIKQKKYRPSKGLLISVGSESVDDEIDFILRHSVKEAPLQDGDGNSDDD